MKDKERLSRSLSNDLKTTGDNVGLRERALYIN
jgi:hypothetical protein